MNPTDNPKYFLQKMVEQVGLQRTLEIISEVCGDISEEMKEKSQGQPGWEANQSGRWDICKRYIKDVPMQHPCVILVTEASGFQRIPKK